MMAKHGHAGNSHYALSRPTQMPNELGKTPDSGTETDEAKIGTGRIMAYALGIWPDKVMSRKTLRALLPRGRFKSVGAVQRWSSIQAGHSSGRALYKNNVTAEMQKRLKLYEEKGSIRRGEHFILILDQRTLLDNALNGIENPRHSKFLALEDAAEIVRQEIEAEQLPALIKLRQRELTIIRQLMKPPIGGRDSRRREVRHEAGGIDIPMGETAARWNPHKGGRK